MRDHATADLPIAVTGRKEGDRMQESIGQLIDKQCVRLKGYHISQKCVGQSKSNIYSHD